MTALYYTAEAMAAFFADQNLTEKEQEIFWEMALNGSAIIDMNGNIVRGLDVSELKGKRIAIIGNHSAGLTQSLLAEVTPQTIAQVDANYWDSLKEEERQNPPKQIIKIEAPLIQQTPVFDTSSTKKRYNRRGKNNKFF